MTIAIAIILLALLLLYCGVKGKSLSRALVGHAEDASSGALIQKSAA